MRSISLEVNINLIDCTFSFHTMSELNIIECVKRKKKKKEIYYSGHGWHNLYLCIRSDQISFFFVFKSILSMKYNVLKAATMYSM